MSNLKNADLKYNDSGCRDMTAYKALRKVQREERRNLITAIKMLARKRGYRIVNAIELEEVDGDIND